jgi:hypothetical protein
VAEAISKRRVVLDRDIFRFFGVHGMEIWEEGQMSIRVWLPPDSEHRLNAGVRLVFAPYGVWWYQEI